MTKSIIAFQKINLIKAKSELPKQFKLFYLDEEGDKITVSTDYDLQTI